MLIRLVVLALLFFFSACRSGEIPCPEPSTARLRKKPGHYLKTAPEEMTASAEDRKLQKAVPGPKKFKTISSIEEWDCPRPGANVIPRSVKQNIKKNRRKFEASVRQKSAADSLSTPSPSSRR